ncbi:MAG: hypothetical protein WCX31_11760 [Salinivirgaceae bacterium]
MSSTFRVFIFKILPAFLFLFPLNSRSQDEIIHYLQNNFKINSQTWGIQASPTNGLVYFATNNGLIEYDGLTLLLGKPPIKRCYVPLK